MPDRTTILTVATVAVADPRSVERVLAGRRLRGDVDIRIRRALAERGIYAPPAAPPAQHSNPNRAA